MKEKTDKMINPKEIFYISSCLNPKQEKYLQNNKRNTVVGMTRILKESNKGKVEVDEDYCSFDTKHNWDEDRLVIIDDPYNQ